MPNASCLVFDTATCLGRGAQSGDTVVIPGNGTVGGTWNVNYSGGSPGSTGAVEIGDPGGGSARVTITAPGQPTSMVAFDCFGENLRIFGSYRGGTGQVYGNIALNGGAISWGFATTITTGASSYGLTVSTTGSNGKSVLVKDTSDYAGITITAGNGSTNPSKTLRCNASTGNFELIDNGYLNIIASITNAGNISFLGGTLSSSASNLNIQATNSSGAVLLTAWNGAANSQVGIAGAVFRSSTDNGTTLGAPSLRWSIVYAATGAINTSDATEKTPLRMLTSAELDCAKDILDGIGIYQWLDAIARKGADKARLHMGVIAQQVQASFIKYGLDPTRYGLFCFDQWDAVAPTLTTDDDGNEVVQMPGVAAGQRYGVRYDELHTFLCACIHQRLLKIEQQLNITS